MPDLLKKPGNASLAAMLFSCSLALFGPAQIFLTNSLEFQSDFFHLLPYLGIVTFCVFLVLALVLYLLPERFRLHERGVAIVLALGILLWLQGNILVWQYGALSGHEIDWGSKALNGLIDTPLWIVGLLLAAWRPGWLYRRVKVTSLLLLAIQLLSTSIAVIRQPETPSFKKFQIDHTVDFDFSSRRNIIVLVLDSFQSDVFQEIINHDPAFGDIFDDFTYFRNTTGGFPSTYGAIPFLLTGQYYANREPIQQFIAQAYRSPSSVPYQLTQHGWQVNLVPAVQNTIFYDAAVFANIKKRRPQSRDTRLAWLYDLTLFRYLPHHLKRQIYNDGHWRLSRWIQKDALSNLLNEEEPKRNPKAALRARQRIRRSSPHISARTHRRGAQLVRKSLQVNSDSRFVSSFLMQSAVVTEKNVFKFYHWRGPHEPIQMNADFEPVDLPLNRANLADMARGELKLVRLFLDGLRELGVYEGALIFILGDHGHPWGAYGLNVPPDLGAQASPGSDSMLDRVVRSGIPLLLVKRPGDRGELQTSDAPASLADVSATIFDELALGRRGVGEPLFRIPADRPRERRFLHYSWEHSDWMNIYLPPLVEYSITGHGWLTSSWRATGKVYEPGG